LEQLQKNKTYIMTIDNLNSEGAGVGRINGMVVFVPLALPGEEIEVLIIKASKSYCVGKLQRVLKASSSRVEPPCPFYVRCGGCVLQHMEYQAQLRAKRHHTEETLSRISHLPIKIEQFIGMDNPWEYRNKAQLPIGKKSDGSTAIGFFARRSHDIIDINACMLQEKSCSAVIAAVRKAIAMTGTLIYDEEKHIGLLRHIVVRVSFSTGKLMLILVTNGNALPQKEKWIALLRAELPQMESLVQNINTQRGNIILGNSCVTLWGKDTITDSLYGIEFELSPLSFLQVNPVQAEKLYEQAIEKAGLTGNELVLDAYCGIGIMTQLLAKRAKKAIGVEIIPQAIEAAKASAIKNGVENVEFLCGACEEVLPRLIKEGMRPDVLVVDPPRAGCDAALLKAIAEAKINKIVYVSCDPSTLAKDIALLAEYGYNTSPVTCVDMFPMTGHVESVMLITLADKK